MDIWEELGIEATTDTRAVRRAYAVKLKSIDQATEPERFERLRAAYTWALQLIENDASLSAHVEEPPAPATEQVAGSPISSERIPESSAQPQSSHVEQVGSDPSWRSPESADVQAIYEAFLARASNRTAQELTDRLRKTLDRLMSLEAREAFELLMLNDVLAPRPFRERLMIAAARAFRWDESLRHLADRSFEPARELHVWLQELAFMEANAARSGMDVDTPIAWARSYFQRRERPVPPAIEMRVIETLRDMQRSFPTVLHYRLGQEIVDYWLSRPTPQTHSKAATGNAPVNGRLPSPQNVQAPPIPQKRTTLTVVLMCLSLAWILALLGMPVQRPDNTPLMPVPSLDPPARSSYKSNCEELAVLDTVRGTLSAEEKRVLERCPAATRDSSHRSDSGLGLKPPADLKPRSPDAR